MEQKYDKNFQPKIPVVYLGTPSHRIVCAVNGIREESFNLEDNLTDTKKIQFDVNRYVDIFEKKVESNVYPLIDLLMRIYIPNVGWFLLNTPVVSNDGKSEYKSISGESEEIEMVDHDIRNLKINKGTTDSYEMLVEGNVDIIDDVEFAKEQIKFCNKEKPELSFLHILLKVSGLYGWTIGEIDSTPKEYLYYEDGELKKKYTLLSDEIGSFDVTIQDLYSFLTQDVAQFFNCIFVFDSRNLTINAYRPENYGKDTNINIGFRNLQQSNEISVDETNLFTRYTVFGSDDLGIEYVNFGSNVIENIEYFLNEKYLLSSTISKYNLWKNDVEKQRPIYIENTKLYNKQLNVISELKNRVPLDDCSTDWSTFEDGELLEAQANYQAQLKGYESYYVDEEGNFDEEALKASPDANDYYQIRDVILPSIAIEIENRNLPPETDPEEYIKTYETDWKLYGLDELEVKLTTYKNRKKVLETSGYDKPFDETTHSKDMWEKLHAEYEEILNQLNPNFVGSCQEAYNQRKQEVDNATALSEEYNKNRQIAASIVNKETWHNADICFTEQDLADLSKLYKDGSYENANMFLTSSDDAVTAIDEQLKLLSAAQDDLYTASQPQYIYTTSLDNFIADYGYENYTHNLNIGDFVYLGIREGYVVKLRIITMSYNPLTMDNNLSIVFSNMLRSKYGRNDSVYLLQSARAGSKSSSQGNGSNYDKNEGVSLTPGLIQKLLQSGAFSNKVNELINNEFAGFIGGGIGGTITIDELNAKMIKVVDIIGENGFFEYLQSKLIVADKIVTESAEIQTLRAKIGAIDDLLAGNVSGEAGQFIHLTVKNTKIDEAVIKNMIASSILVSDLKAGDITLSNAMRIVSSNGSMVMNGTTLQIKGQTSNGEEYVAIQLGYDKNSKPSLIIRDENGAVMLDGSGLHEGIVPDNFIKTEMIGDSQVTEDKIDKTGMQEWTDSEGNKIFDVSKMYFGKDKFEVSYTSLKESVNETKTELSGVSNKVNAVEKNITNKVWKSDISTEINKYDNSTVDVIRDQVAENKTEIGKISSTVSDVQTKVEKKADGSTVHELSNKVSKIEQDASGFKQTVEATYAKKTDLKTTSENLRSEFTQTAEKIEQKVTATDGRVTSLTTDVKGLQTKVQNAEGDISELEQKANEFSVTVKETYATKNEMNAAIKVQSDSITQSVKKQIDEIEVGGRNFWENGNFKNKNLVTGNITVNNACSVVDIGDDNPTGFKYALRSFDANSRLMCSRFLGDSKELIGKTLTFQCWIKFENVKQGANTWNRLNIGKYALTYTYKDDSKTSTNYGSFIDTIKIGVGDSDWIHLKGSVEFRSDVKYVNLGTVWIGLENATSGTFWVTGIKLELGNKPTDWTPAPEDMATFEDAQNAQVSADEAQKQAKDASDLAKKNENRLSISESTIKQLSDSICTMVKDQNGSTVLTQNSTGWKFDLSAIEKNLNNTANEMNKLSGTVSEVDSAIENLNNTINDLGKKTAYIVMTTDENGDPCIELGKEDNPFKVRITNTSVDFLEGTSRIAYVNNKALYIEKAVIKNELQIGEGKGFVWQIRANGNMGLRKIG